MHTVTIHPGKNIIYHVDTAKKKAYLDVFNVAIDTTRGEKKVDQEACTKFREPRLACRLSRFDPCRGFFIFLRLYVRNNS